MALAKVKKDPQAVLDYGIEWDDWLIGADAIVASTWVRTGDDNALTISQPYFDAKVAGVWAAGGTVGATYVLTNHVTTSQGRQDDRTIIIQVEER